MKQFVTILCLFLLVGCQLLLGPDYITTEEGYYIQTESESGQDVAWWQFSEWKVYGAVRKGTDTNHIRGSYEVIGDTTLRWLLYNRGVLARDLDSVQSLMHVNDTMDTVPCPPPYSTLTCIVKDTSADTLLPDEYTQYVWETDPNTWYASSMPVYAKFYIDYWKPDSIHLSPKEGTHGPAFEGVSCSGPLLSDPRHPVYAVHP